MSTFKTCYGLPKRSPTMSYAYDDDEDDKYGHIPISVIELSRKNVELLRRKQREAVGNCCCCSLIKNCRLYYLISYLPVHSKPIETIPFPAQPAPPSPKIQYEPPVPGTTNDLSIGSLVEISNDVTNEPLYGVVRWLGAEVSTKRVLVGVELEEEQQHLPLTLTDGTHNGRRYFECAENRAIFVPLSQCHKDSRFVDDRTTGAAGPSLFSPEKMFGKEVSNCFFNVLQTEW